MAEPTFPTLSPSARHWTLASAALGLEPNTPAGLSYLIPYKERRKDPVTGKWGDVWVCQMQISYRGFITLAHRSKAVLTVKAAAIRRGAGVGSSLRAGLQRIARVEGGYSIAPGTAFAALPARRRPGG